jgi:hypothetical protein
MREINRLPSSPTRFVVLNFPPGTPIDPLFVKRAIKLLGKRLVRRFPNCSTHWRLEFTEIGVPHIHLMGDFDHISKDLLTEQIFQMWRGILGFNAPEPENIVDVQVPPDSDVPIKVRYFCKYKRNDVIGTRIYCKQYDSTGRCCGIFNRVKANLAPVKRRICNEDQRDQITALIVKTLEQRLIGVQPGVNVLVRQAFIDRVKKGNDTGLNFLTGEFMEGVDRILDDAA